jgi:drug/metabolite transporter (DMT)-like permease
MSWILLATAGQLLNAVVAFLDKYIVTDERAMPRPFVYAFYSCLLTSGWLVVFALGYIPGFQTVGLPHLSNIELPSIQVVSMAFLTGYTFFMALVSMYTALQKSEAINVLPVIGSVSAVTAFGMNYLFLGVTLTQNFIFGIVVLSLGTLLVAQTLPKLETIVHVVHSGLFFALHFITMKGLFLETSFDDGFFWSRIGFLLFALSLLLVPAYYTKIKERTAGTSVQTGMLVVSTKVLAGVAAFLLLKATDWGDVAVVQALDGLKFVFILVITFFFGAMLPNSAVEHTTKPRDVIRQILYVGVIVVGYVLLFM